MTDHAKPGTQAQFSALLAHEARSVIDASKAKTPAAASLSPAKIAGYDKMSVKSRFVAAVAKSRS